MKFFELFGRPVDATTGKAVKGSSTSQIYEAPKIPEVQVSGGAEPVLTAAEKRYGAAPISGKEFQDGNLEKEFGKITKSCKDSGG